MTIDYPFYASATERGQLHENGVTSEAVSPVWQVPRSLKELEEPAYRLTSADRAIWDQIYAEEQIQLSPKDCKGINRFGNINFPGTLEHWMIQMDYLATGTNREVEYQVPEGSLRGYRGYADLVDYGTGEMFEIKPNNDIYVQQGQVELNYYISKATAKCGRTWGAGTNYAAREIPYPKGVYLDVELQPGKGVITYRHVAGDKPKGHLTVPSTVLERLRSMINRLKNEFPGRFEEGISSILREPAYADLVQYLKVAAIGARVTLILATIVQDIATAGIGVADDIATISLAYRIIRFGVLL